MTAALLVIDVQHALCAGAYEAFDVVGLIDRINLVSRKARDVGMPVVIIQHESEGGALDYGSEGWKLESALCVDSTDLHVRKKATDSFHQTELQSLLQKHGVTELMVCGLQSEFCVDTTTRRALALGYPVTLIADGHSTIDNAVLSAAQISAHHNATLCNITSFGPRAIAVAAADIRMEDFIDRSKNANLTSG